MSSVPIFKQQPRSTFVGEEQLNFYNMVEGIVLPLIFIISFWCLYTLKKKENWFFLVLEPLSFKEFFYILFVLLGIFTLTAKGYMPYTLAWLFLAYFTFEYRSKIFINPSFTLELRNNPLLGITFLFAAVKTGDFTSYQIHHAFSMKTYSLSQEHIALYKDLWKNQSHLLPVLKSVNACAMNDPRLGNSLMQTFSGSIMLSTLPEKDFNIHTDYLTKKLGLSPEQIEFFKRNYLPDIYEKAKFVRDLSSVYDTNTLKLVQPEREFLKTSQDNFQCLHKGQPINVPLEAIGVHASFNSLVLASSTLDVPSRLEILCNDPSASKIRLNSGFSPFNFKVEENEQKGYSLAFVPNYTPELCFIEQGLNSNLIISWERVGEGENGDYKIKFLLNGEVVDLNKNIDVKCIKGDDLVVPRRTQKLVLALDVSEVKKPFDELVSSCEARKSVGQKPLIIFNSSSIKFIK